jgi:uncharacterized protein YjdB
MIKTTLYEMIDHDGLSAIGKTHLLKHIDGGKLSRKEAMQAKCYDCMGYFIDGRADCRIKNCPMFDYRPFKDRPESKKIAKTMLSEANKEVKTKKTVNPPMNAKKRKY